MGVIVKWRRSALLSIRAAMRRPSKPVYTANPA
jgi:hypothetical protein